MTDVTLGSDAFFPFSDNIERAYKSGVKYIAQPGGSVRDADVIDTCNKYNIAMAFTGIRYSITKSWLKIIPAIETHILRKFFTCFKKKYWILDRIIK